MSTIDQLAAGLVTTINGHDWEEVEFTAEQKFLPRIERKSMGDGWHVWVVPADLLRSPGRTRKRSRRMAEMHVGLIRRLSDIEPATVNPCLALSDAMQDFIDRDVKQLAGHDLDDHRFEPLYSEMHLKETSVYLSVLVINFLRQ